MASSATLRLDPTPIRLDPRVTEHATDAQRVRVVFVFARHHGEKVAKIEDITSITRIALA